MVMAVCALGLGSPLLICKGSRWQALGAPRGSSDLCCWKIPPNKPWIPQTAAVFSNNPQLPVLSHQPRQTQSCVVTNVSPVPSEMPPALTHCQNQEETLLYSDHNLQHWGYTLKKRAWNKSNHKKREGLGKIFHPAENWRIYFRQMEATVYL